MEPLPGEQMFRSRIDNFDKKTIVSDPDIHGIKQLILKNPDCLLVLDKSILSRLEVKLMSGGIPQNDQVMTTIHQVLLAWRNDLTQLFKEVAEGLSLFQKLASLKVDDKLIIYCHRMGGDYELTIAGQKTSEYSLPWKLLSSVGSLALYQTFEFLPDVMKILQSKQIKIIQNTHKLIQELSEKNISKPDFEMGLGLLTSILSCFTLSNKRLKLFKK